MNSFTYQASTKIIFGKGTETGVGIEVRNLGFKKVLVHYGGPSAVKSGLLDRVINSLKENNIEFITLGGVVPNPRLSKVYEGIELGKKENIDFIVAIGGGSVIDSAKSIAIGLANPDIDIWQIYDNRMPIQKCLKLGAITTIPAAGSEFSQFSVITNDYTNEKKGYGSPMIRPEFAILNPELTYSVPKYQTASGIADIMMHTMDKYITISDDNELSDSLSEALLKTVINIGPRSLVQPDNYISRSELMWAGALSQNDILGLGAVKDSASHQIEHELGAMFDVAHGAGLAAIWGTYARYVYKSNLHRFCKYAVNIWGCNMNEEDPEQTALDGIIKTEEFFKSIGMPISIGELGIGKLSEEAMRIMADKCVHYGKRTVGSMIKLNKEDVYEIYKQANH